MKTRFSKILAISCCVALLCTMFSSFASAHTFNTESIHAPHGAEPVVENYQWETVSTVVSTEQTAKYFIIHTETENHAEDLYLSFPEKEGGFRLQSKHEYQETVEVSNVGLFEPDAAVIEYKAVDGAVVMKGADGTVVKYTQSGTDFKLSIYKDSKFIISIGNGQIHFGYSTKWLNKGEIVATMVEMPMNYDNEAIYNGSQRYCETNVVGQHFSLTNNDCFSADAYAYGNIPLFHSNRGYSVWFNMTYPGEANFGCEQDDTVSKEKYSITFYGDKLDFFLWTGEPLENLKKYTKITGTSGMTEEWTFGFWTGATGEAWTSGDGALANVQSIMDGYMEKYGFYPEAVYSEGAFDNAAAAAYLDSINVRSLDWVWTKTKANGDPNYISQFFDNSFSALPTANSTGWPLPFSELGLKFGNYYIHVDSEYADCSNPSLATYLKNFFTPKWNIEGGYSISGTMLDMNEMMSFNGVAYNGLSSMEMHNLNSYYYAKYGREVWEANYNGKYKNDFVLFQRSAAAGTQYYVSGFQGDQRSTWAGYQAAIRDMISRSAGGFNLFGADLGGLGGTPQTQDLWNRWVVFSVFQPYMRQHGTVIHEPWDYGDIATANFGKFYYLRKNIVPSIMDAAMRANRTSDPIVKGMMMAYPKDLSLRDIDTQYLFCNDFLVCAVTENSHWYLDVQLPVGNTWYNLFTYEAVAGKTGAQTVAAPNNWMPVYVKDGSVKAINLPDSMTLMDDMPNTATEHPSLLITPPDAGNGRKTVIYNKEGQSEDFRTYDYTTETYVNTPVDNATFTVTNKEKTGSSRQIVLALGVTAYSVSYTKADGQTVTLNSLSTKPTFGSSDYGYYVDAGGMTTIYLPTGWKELKVEKGNAQYTKLTNISVSDFASDSGEIIDGNIKVGAITPSTSGYFRINLAESKNIGRIVLHWNPVYVTKYTLEVSNSMYTGYSTVVTETEGDGGMDVWDVSATGRYIRFKRQSSETSPVLQEIEVYSKTASIEKMDAGSVSCATAHDYGDAKGDTCVNCGYVRATVEEYVEDGRYTATVNAEDGKEIKVGSLLFTNMKGEQAVPVRVGFQQVLDVVAEYTVPDGYSDEGIEVTFETIAPTLDNPNVGNIGTSITSTINPQMRFVSRFTRVEEGGNEYVVMADGTRYLIKDYGVVLAAKAGLDFMPNLTTDAAMVLNSANRYVQSVSVKKQQVFYDLCNAYVDMAVTITGIKQMDAEGIPFYSRAYVTVETPEGDRTLYGACTYAAYSDFVG